jgi:hypothetical protein
VDAGARAGESAGGGNVSGDASLMKRSTRPPENVIGSAVPPSDRGATLAMPGYATNAETTTSTATAVPYATGSDGGVAYNRPPRARAARKASGSPMAPPTSTSTRVRSSAPGR